MALRDRLMRRPPAQAEPGAEEGAQQGAPPQPAQQRRPPTPGQVRRERRALVRAREDRIRDLGGLMLEMYKRDRLKPELFFEQCAEIVSIEERIQELDGALAALTRRTMAEANRCACGAPLVWGAHFCANCGRPVGEAPVVVCAHCGNPLPAEATFCSNCGRPAEPAEASYQTNEPESQEPTIAGQG
jgi:Double zinc ribbon